jgi:hypothetical protein
MNALVPTSAIVETPHIQAGESSSAIGRHKVSICCIHAISKVAPLSAPQVLCADAVDISRPNFLVEAADPWMVPIAAS